MPMRRKLLLSLLAGLVAAGAGAFGALFYLSRVPGTPYQGDATPLVISLSLRK